METERITMHLNPLPTLFKFDKQLPIYNWLYPFGIGNEMTDPFSVFSSIDPHPRLRALYFHIPFCDTICSFCPFVRGEYESQDEIDRYVQALLREIEFKHQYTAIRDVPVDCIYFGGGTPSVLSAKHFYQLGEALHRHFDLSQLKEFTIECEVKSVTLEKIKAWQDIGVNRTSFGVQTFNPFYRELFTMTATVDQIRRVAAWVTERFPFNNVDMIHGMAGQTLDDFVADIDSVNELGMTTVDYYTLNNVVSQPRLHRSFQQKGLKPLSANTRVSYRMFLNEYLRAQGYVPHNSYAFTRNTAPAGSSRVIIQRDPVFLYQEITYGFSDDQVVGFGAGGISQLGTYLVENIANREQYMLRFQEDKLRPWFNAYSDRNVADKGLIYFPYRGVLEKSRIDWAKVHPETRAALDESVTHGLAIDRGDVYELTEAGWLFAVNYMYSLIPHEDQVALSEIIARSATNQSRQPDVITFFPRKQAVDTGTAVA